MVVRETPTLAEALNRLRATTNLASRLAADPVGIVHRFADPLDVEITGLVAASLAFGNVTALRASIERALSALGPRPGQTVRDASFADLDALLDGLVHRTVRGHDVARMLAGAGALVRRHGSLGAAVKSRFFGELRPALGALVTDIRAESGAAARLRSGTKRPAELLPDPLGGSACKRLLLYLRWMVRPADGVDFGLWDLPARILVVPLDTHVHRIARNLGLTSRRDVSWRTAEEVTAALRRFDPADPVGYDFALCHMGISRACPSRRDPERCRGCGLEPHCVR